LIISLCIFSYVGEATALDYNPMTRRFFVGLDDGSIQEFDLSEDFNKVTLKRTYLGNTDLSMVSQYSRNICR